MNYSAPILKELQELSPALAAVPRLNVYSVPKGYFDNLSGEVLLRVYGSEAEQFKNTNSATVPEGYFENLAGNILARIKTEANGESGTKEIPAISAVLDEIGNRNVFDVPAGYFDKLPGIVLERINEKADHNVFSETNSISAVVAGLGNKNVYNVPAGYFESLVINRVGDKKTAKVISLKGRSNIIRYAAAAVITGIVAVSSFFIIGKNENGTTNNAQSAAMAEAKNILQTNSFDEQLASVSDEAIVNFLESKGQDVEAALVASLSDDKNLPSTTDYLFNAETLDNVLKTIDLNN